MDAVTWDRIQSSFLKALDLPPGERSRWLDELDSTDPGPAIEVRQMLDAHFDETPLRLEQWLAGVPTEAAPLLRSGDRVDVYRVDDLLAAGGMAEVYRAERVDGLYRQTVALKVLRPGYSAAEFARLFAAERQILARLQHPSIAAILGGGTTSSGLPYLVMQLVQGLPITRFCREHDVSLRDRLRLFVRVCEAVQYAHGQLIVHRDLKPSNILVTEAGEPVLLDFGIAGLLSPTSDGAHEDAEERATRLDIRLFTPGYAAPEQRTGGPVTTAADVYGLGSLLFELLSHRRRLDGELPAPSKVVRNRRLARRLSGDLDRIVGMALRADPGERYTSAGELADDVRRYLAGLPVRAGPDSAAYRARKFVRRHRGLLAAVAVFVSLLAASAAASLVQARRVAAERDIARAEREESDAVVGLLTSLFEAANPRLVPGADTLRISSFLEQTEAEIERLGDQPALQATMWRVVGNMHAARSRFDRAVPLLERAHELQVGLTGPDDPKSARIEHDLGMVLLAFAGPDRALPLLRSSADRLARGLGEEHSSAVVAVQDVALATPDADERRRLLARVVELKSGPGDSVQTAGFLNAQASDHLAAGRYREALVLFEAAGDILDRTLGANHPHRLTVAGNTAAALSRLGEFDRAEVLNREVLTARLPVLGEESQEVAIARENLAIVNANQGRFVEADSLLDEALRTFERNLAHDHWRIANTLRNLGLVRTLAGDPATGLVLLDSAIALVPETETGAAYMTGQRVLPLLLLGHPAEASRAAATAYLGVNRLTPEAHPYRADVAVTTGIIALEEDRPEEAEARFRRALSILEARLPSKHPLLHQAACGIAVSRALPRGDLDAPADASSGPCSAYARWGLASPILLHHAGIAAQEGIAAAR